jgi:hypothetical protein
VTLWADHKGMPGSSREHALLASRDAPSLLCPQNHGCGTPKHSGIKFLNLECEFLRHEMYSECDFLCLTQKQLWERPHFGVGHPVLIFICISSLVKRCSNLVSCLVSYLDMNYLLDLCYKYFLPEHGWFFHFINNAFHIANMFNFD